MNPNGPNSESGGNQAGEPARRSSRSRNRRRARRPANPATPVEQPTAPFVALSIKTTGIHPSSAKIVAIDALTFDEEGKVHEEFYEILNPGGDPGPKHLHGLSKEDTDQAQKFSRVLKRLGTLIDGRTLVVHDSPYTWGFIVSEAKRAMSSAARANRSRNRQRGRRRQRVGHVPRPTLVVDTLASARRQGHFGSDNRIRAIAADLGLETSPAVASVERAHEPAATTHREETLLVLNAYRLLAEEGKVSGYPPADLRPDRYGLQRSHVRVDAVDAPRDLINPGVYTEETGLIAGMEVVVAPEITLEPDEIVARAVRAGLAYSEKTTRESSLVVCNLDPAVHGEEFVGKPMHAYRKDIPIMSDRDFLAIVDSTAPGTPRNKPDA